MTFGIHKWSDLKNLKVESYFRCDRTNNIYLYISFYKIIQMKYIFIFFSFTAFSQEVSRSTISVVGNSTTTVNGYYVTQSVGQLSTIGFSEIGSNSIVEGYQQPTSIKVIDASIIKEIIELYPIPVSDKLNFLFSLSINGKCNVEVFDRLGRLVMNQELSIIDYTSSISLANLAASTYIIKIATNTTTHYETIIKK
jgi:hypothetical protein